MPTRRVPVAKTVLVLSALALAFLPLPASWVELVYSQGIYRALQPVMTTVTNQVPVALFDPLVVLLAAAFLIFTVRTIRAAVYQRRARVLVGAAATLGVGVSAVYLAFLLLWGLNYRRQPVTTRIVVDRGAVTARALRDMGAEAVRQMNELHPLAHGRAFADWAQLPMTLGPSFRAVHQRLVPAARPVPGVPKWSLLSPFFARAGVSGMTDPFFLEVLVDRGLLPFERAFVAAHEWAHLAGYGDEAEANFLGWLTCVNADAQAAYSGWMYLYTEVQAALPRTDRIVLARAVASGPRADLLAVAERASRIQPALQAASWRVYDRYLKANRVEEGVHSYSRALVLVLGAQYKDGWRPLTTGR